MKNVCNTVAAILFCVGIVLPYLSQAAEPIRVNELHKENGRSVLFGLCEERYRNVYNYETTTTLRDPLTNEDIWIVRNVLSCSDPGSRLCRRSNSSKLYSYHGVCVSDEFFYKIESELYAAIDFEMINNGNYSGGISKKIFLTNEQNKLILLFNATWSKGDENGNGDIVIKVYDITDQISLRQ